MKPRCILLAALLLPLCALAADQVWRAELATTEVRNLYLRHGESADLVARLLLLGRPYEPTNAVCYYQTNEMAQAWWTAPCSITGNTVRVFWSPELDPGADVVSMVIRLDDSAYRAAAMLYLRPSPGAAPNTLPPPTQWLDFDKISWTNAPWALPSDVASAVAEVASNTVTRVNGKTGEVVLSGKDVDIGYPGSIFGTTNEIISVARTALLIEQRKANAADVWPKSQSYSKEQVDTMFHTVNETVAGVAGSVATVANDNVAQSNAIAALQSAVADVPVPDYSATNDELVATIQAVAPAPGNYATVSNRAMSAYQKPATGIPKSDLSSDVSKQIGHLLTFDEHTDLFPSNGSIWERGKYYIFDLGNVFLSLPDNSGVDGYAFPAGRYRLDIDDVVTWRQGGINYAALPLPPGRSFDANDPSGWYFLVANYNTAGQHRGSLYYGSNPTPFYVTDGNLEDVDTTGFQQVFGEAFGEEPTIERGILLEVATVEQITESLAAATNYTDSATNALATSIPSIPTVVSVFSNDVGYLTTYTESDPTVPAWAKTENPPSGGADMASVSNTVSDLLTVAIAEAPEESTLEVLRLAVADLWEIHDKLAVIEAYDDIVDAIDSLVASAVASSLTNYATKAQLSGYVPTSRKVNNKALSANVTLTASDVGAIPVAGYSSVSPADLGASPYIYVEFYGSTRVLSYTGSGTLDVGGLYAPNGPPCHLVLSGFSSVAWPTNDHPIVDGTYDSSNINYYEIGGVNGETYVRFLFSR
ncbi:MAG: hypothetical protein IJL06_04935 [Kiritimatiellae bacterium]|nr:hypothetical protein [Kiritimatiellia bacterium]